MSRARDIANYGDGIDTSSITSGTFADARIPNLATSKITSGTFADARIAASNVTQHEGSIDALASNPTVTLGSNTTFGSGVSLTNATFPADHVLQVKSTTKKDVFSQTSSSAASPVTITGLTVDITPSSTSNKILVMYALDVSGSITTTFHTFLFRGSTGICIGDAASSQPRATMAGIGHAVGGFSRFNLAAQFLDSPSTTSQVTYSIKVGANGTATAYINRSERDDPSSTINDARGTSTITVMEIVG